MPTMFGRQAAITVHDRKITGLRMQFKVDKTSKPDPNTLDLTIYNLSADTRARLAATKRPQVIVEAGYQQTEQLFKGDARTVYSVRQGPDWLTKVQCGDGERAYQFGRTDESFAPGTKTDAVVKRLVSDMGVGVGNALKKLKDGDFSGAMSTFVNGFTVSGNSADQFDRIMKSSGLDWSIQDGELQVLKPGTATDESAVLLTPDTGLVGSPEVGEDGVVKFTSLLQPGMRPGRKVQLKAAAMNGLFVLQRVTHQGDTHGLEWYTICEAKAL